MIVIDYHTWDDAPSAPGVHHTYGSDRLNPACWPDVKGMMAELSAEPRVEVMISPCGSIIDPPWTKPASNFAI